MPKAVISVEGAGRRYGGVRALSGVTLEVRRGEVLGVLGPSGAGKSTLLRLLALLDAPTEGTVLFNGRPASAYGDGGLKLRRRLAAVLQKPVVFRGTVFGNVAFGLRARGLPERVVGVRADRALGSVGLARLGDRPASALSGGEVQRLAFARAAVLRPEVLLLDEYTANLDPANVALLERLVLEFNEGGGTVLLVTHNPAQARRLADRVGLLIGGRLVEVAPAGEFFESPSSSAARDFLSGRMAW